ncbi:glycosyltransferase family 2 protein [Acidiferrobacter sp.]|uniref:glycosyltransferase family 2 protein n=1 Tax=Acidiferrobacter sp. TaxID=1872107 RepID=UPI0026354D5D|nr:glycosyltransferase family 2 protein [Acidiferrobacter sp.]
MSLSIIIVTNNEEFAIRRCLESVAWADEIVVVDSGSRDNTTAICREFTDKIVHADWRGFGPQKNLALGLATGEWVLSLDADEYFLPGAEGLVREAISCGPGTSAYRLSRVSSYCGRWIRHSGWAPDYVTRLFARHQGRFSDDAVHERLEVRGRVATLDLTLYHEAFVDLEEVLAKVDRYSTLGAQSMHRRGCKATLGQAVTHGLWAFLRAYFLRGGFADGREGFMLAVSNAEGAYYRYAKLMLLSKPGNSSNAPRGHRHDI